MNKAYNNQYESNCKFIGVERKKSDAASTSGESILETLASSKFLNIFHAVCSVIFFFAFIGIIGGMDAGTVSVGLGITVSIFMLFTELLCFGIKAFVKPSDKSGPDKDQDK